LVKLFGLFFRHARECSVPQCNGVLKGQVGEFGFPLKSAPEADSETSENTVKAGCGGIMDFDADSSRWQVAPLPPMKRHWQRKIRAKSAHAHTARWRDNRGTQRENRGQSGSSPEFVLGVCPFALSQPVYCITLAKLNGGLMLRRMIVFSLLRR
jgi:hypothetical protein